MRTIKHIVVHCSATRRSMDIGAKEIRKWHKDKGWNDIGYHYVIRRDGSVEKGRKENVIGAHVKGYNKHSIGICMVGGVDGYNDPQDNFTSDQYETLRLLIDGQKEKHPKAKVLGHRDFPNVNKACPCFDVIPWYADLKPIIKSRTLAGSAVSTLGIAGGTIAEATESIKPLIEYSDIAKMLFVAVSLIGIGLVIYAKLDDRKHGRR